MTDKIVPLRPSDTGSIPGEMAALPDVVEVFERLLKEAQSGKIQMFAIAVLGAHGDTKQSFGGQGNLLTMLGSVYKLLSVLDHFEPEGR